MAFNPDKPYQVLEEDQFDPSKPYEETPTGLSSINKPVQASAPTKIPFAGIDTSTPTTARGFSPPPQISEPSNAAQTAASVYRPILEYGGAIGAEALAAPAIVASGPAAPVTAVAAGTLGYATGSQLSDILDRAIGIKKEPTSAGEIAGEAIGSLREGVSQELVGRPAGKIIEKGLSAVTGGIKTAIKKTPELYRRVSDAAKRIGIDLTPAELAVTRGGSKALSIMESVLDNTVFTAGIMRDFNLSRIKALNDLRDALLAKQGSVEEIETLGYKIKAATDDYFRRFGLENKAAQTAMKNRLQQKLGAKVSYEDLDISGKQAIVQYEKQESEKISKAYTALREKADDLLPEGAVPENLLKTAQNLLKEQESIGNPALVDKEISAIANGFLGNTPKINPDILQAYATATPEMKLRLEALQPELLLGFGGEAKKYSQLDNIVKALNAKKYSQIDINGKITNTGRQLDALIDAAHKDMAELAKKTGDEALIKSHDAADLLFKNRLALFEDEAYKKITKTNPGSIVNTIYRSGEPDLIRRYQALVGKDVSEMAKKKLTGEVLGFDLDADMTGAHIRTQLEKLGEGKSILYSPQELKYFDDLADAIDLRSTDVEGIMKNPMFKALMNESRIPPSSIAKFIVGKQNTGIPVVIENRFGPAVKKKIADGFLPTLLGANQVGDFLPSTFAKEFDKYGKPTIEAWYGKETADLLEDIATVGRTMREAQKMGSNPSGTARNMIFFRQGESIARAINKATGALAVAAVTGANLGQAVLGLGALAGEGLMILGSRELAELYTSPAGRNLFIDGLMTKAGTKEAAQITGKILSILGNEISREKEK